MPPKRSKRLKNPVDSVIFQERPATARAQADAERAPSGAGHQILQLESELRSTKDHLQATIEEVETSNEELSVNEELETINAELSKKVEELDAVNGDLQNLLQSTQIPTLFLDNGLRIKRFTEAATSVFHLIDSDVGRPITDMAPRFEADMVADLKEVQRTLVAKERTVRLVDGSSTYLMRVLPYRRMDGIIDGLVLTYLELTQLDHALAQKARLAAIVESSQDAIIGCTLDGTITTWNQAASEMFGYATLEALGSSLRLFLPVDGMEEIERAHEQMRRGESVAPYESVWQTRNGRPLNLSIAMSPIKDAQGRLIGASAIFRDISELKQVQEQLRRETHEKDQFLALLSHELRNPLAPLRTSLEILRGQAPEPQVVERSLHIMDRQLTQLTTLVDQLLDAARISSGKILLDPVALDLAGLVGDVLEDHRRVIVDARLRLTSRLPERPVYVRADRVRLSQAIGNLISNAAKFTEEGGQVTVSVEAHQGRSLASISVSDDGMGMDSATQHRLFQPFVQSGEASQRSRGGLGLGLWLVKGLIDAHGGTVGAYSKGPGEGTQVTIRLPLSNAPERTRAGKASQGPEQRVRRRILIVEDNPDALESLRKLLELQGHTIEVADTGTRAVESALSFQPEVVLCDIQLRGNMDGYEVAAAIRGQGDGSTYLVALTGYGQRDDRERTRQAGFDWHLIKPPKHEELTRLLAELPRGQS